MALKSTIYKVKLNISDLDRNLYGDFALSVARHPSETEARMMLRVAAFALNADAQLEFGRGISTDDEPDLWRKDLTGSIELWIDLGTPDPDRLRKACGRAEQVVLYAYGDRALEVWWEKNRESLARFDNLSVYSVADADCAYLATLASPRLDLQCTVSDGELWLTEGEHTTHLKPKVLRLSN
ncbi:MAG: YaeQ family protein [Xanthomonadales bacterium]|nr:YaeQ family protein [Xanthomonadales bacterium]